MNLDWLPKGTGKWLGIVIGLGVVVSIFFPKIQCGGETVRNDTTYVQVFVPALPETVLVVKKLPGKVSYKEDPRRIDSLVAATRDKDSLIAFLLQPQEAEVPINYRRDSVLKIDGWASAVYVPLDTAFDITVYLDSVQFRQSIPPPERIGPGVEQVGLWVTIGAIGAWALAIIAQ